MKSSVKREDLKNNFLKNIIVRFDYTGIAEAELDSVITKIKPIFKADGYNKLKEDNLTELDFQLLDPEDTEIDNLPIKEIRRKMAYVFINEEKGITCKLSTQFAAITVQNKKYIPFSEYSGTLFKVIKTLKEEVEFLSCFRFGIRKINQCIITDISRLNNYFENGLYQIYGLTKKISKLFEVKDCFAEEDYDINLIRTVVVGEYEGKIAHQVSLDTDIYIAQTEKIEELFIDNTKLIAMNERLFELYKDALTEEFISELGKDEYHDSSIIGVEKNE